MLLFTLSFRSTLLSKYGGLLICDQLESDTPHNVLRLERMFVTLCALHQEVFLDLFMRMIVATYDPAQRRE